MRLSRWRSSWVWLQCLAFALVSTSNGDARGFEGDRTNSVSLIGTWEFFVGDGSERAESVVEQASLDWRAVQLPGPFMKWSEEAANNTKVVWARRNFTVTPAQARGLAVLRWNRIANGAAAFINGQKIG